MIFGNCPSRFSERIAPGLPFYLQSKYIGYVLAFSAAALLLHNPASSHSQDSSLKTKSNALTPTPVPRPAISPPAANPSGARASAVLFDSARAVPPLPHVSVPPKAQSQIKEDLNESSTPVKIEQRYGLPPASRQRLHECAIEWQKMKLDGGTNDKIWRDFAQVCLVK